jgi:hypothetical protein
MSEERTIVVSDPEGFLVALTEPQAREVLAKYRALAADGWVPEPASASLMTQLEEWLT